MNHWPPISYETLPWVSSTPMSARARQKQPTEYRSAIPPTIANIRDITSLLTAETLTLADRATITATRFDVTRAAQILPFTPLLLRGESVASSRIEQLTSSARRILEAELLENSQGPRGSHHPQGNAALIVAATTQMSAAAHSVTIPTVASILTMHKLLMEQSSPDVAGVYRTEPVWIGGSDTHPVDSLFTPPAPHLVPKLMDDLTSFMARQDIPALVLAAISHAQFETIHPFVDGNGRTGRALMHQILKAQGLSTNGTLPLSAGILEDPDTYFDALNDYRRGDIDTIVRLIAHAALRGTELGQWLGDELTEVRLSWSNLVHSRKDAVDWRILDLLLRRPIIDAQAVSGELQITPVNARRALDRLESTGILLSSQVDKGRRAWRAPEILELLDEFAERAGHRRAPSA